MVGAANETSMLGPEKWEVPPKGEGKSQLGDNRTSTGRAQKVGITFSYSGVSGRPVGAVA